MRIPKSLERYKNRIAELNDERKDESPIFVVYAKGWCSHTYAMGDRHTDRGYNVKEVLYYVRRAVPCTCKHCNNPNA
jgi:hypothetical protein